MRDVVGYAVGEYVDSTTATRTDQSGESDDVEDGYYGDVEGSTNDRECYEVVTAWVDTR